VGIGFDLPIQALTEKAAFEVWLGNSTGVPDFYLSGEKNELKHDLAIVMPTLNRKGRKKLETKKLLAHPGSND
tara:strand:+ start:234 stop:452 length:219 start_codon:yes stop_codon:yes gene_type:complete